MKCALRSFNNIVEHTSSPGFFRVFVLVDGRVANKAGTQVSDKSVIEIKAEIPKYVCRAGHKLEAAIKEFGVDCDGKVALDPGLSTGGFTDCLLQHGVLRVYGVDVGYGQVMPAVVKVMKMDSILITLIKPQFEAHRSQVGGGGIVRDPLVHKAVLDRIPQDPNARATGRGSGRGNMIIVSMSNLFQGYSWRMLLDL